MANTIAELSFLKPLDKYGEEKPYWLFIGKPKNAPDVDTTNVVTEFVKVPIHDVRGNESEYALDKQGFQFIVHGHKFQSFEDEDLIVQEYLPQVEETIRSTIPGVDKVVIYDWRVCITCLLRTNHC